MAEMDMNEILEKARRAQAALSSELNTRHAYAEGLSGNAPAQEAGKNQLPDLSGAYVRKWIADRQKAISAKIAYYEGRKNLDGLEKKNLKDLQKEKEELDSFSSTIGRKNSLTLDDQVAFVDVQITAEENKQKLAALQMQKIIPGAHTEADSANLPEQKREKYNGFKSEHIESQHEIDALKRRKRSLVAKRAYENRKEQQGREQVVSQTPRKQTYVSPTVEVKEEKTGRNDNGTIKNPIDGPTKGPKTTPDIEDTFDLNAIAGEGFSISEQQTVSTKDKNKNVPQKEETGLTTTTTPSTTQDKKSETNSSNDANAEHDETKSGPRKAHDTKNARDSLGGLSMEQFIRLRELVEQEGKKGPDSIYEEITMKSPAKWRIKCNGKSEEISSKELYDRLNPEKTAETGEVNERTLSRDVRKPQEETGVAVPKKNSNHAYATDPDEKPAAITGQVAAQAAQATEEKKKPTETVVEPTPQPTPKTAPVQTEEKNEPVKQETAEPEKKEEKKESTFLKSVRNGVWPLFAASVILSCLPGLAFLNVAAGIFAGIGVIVGFAECIIPEIKDVISDIKNFVAHVKENKKIKENQKILQKAKDKDKTALNELNARKKQLNKTLGTETVTKNGKKVKRPTHATKTPLRKEAFAKYDNLKRHVKELKDIDEKYGFNEEKVADWKKAKQKAAQKSSQQDLFKIDSKYGFGAVKVAEWEKARKGVDPNDKAKLEEIDKRFGFNASQVESWKNEKQGLETARAEELKKIDEQFGITEEQAKKWEKERNPLLSRIEANSLSDAMRLEGLAKTQYAEAKQAEADAIQEAQAELKTVEERIETQQEAYKKSKATFDKFVANPTSEPFEEFQLKDEPAPQPQPQASQVKFDDASKQAGQSKNTAREM